MTVRLVAVPPGVWRSSFEKLVRDAESAAKAFEIALPGERAEAIRYGEVAALIESSAAELAGGDAIELPTTPGWLTSTTGVRHSWVRPRAELPRSDDASRQWVAERLVAGCGVVELHDIVPPGATDAAAMNPLPPVAYRSSPAGQVQPDVTRSTGGRRGDAGERIDVIARRFTEQVRLVDDGRPLNPSDVPDAVLAQGLRDLAATNPACAPTRVRVVYGDGSEGPLFPRASVEFGDQVEPSWAVLSLAMISMRHPEMDHLVSGAVLRNVEVSRAVAHGHVDALAYQRAREALESLTGTGPIHVRVYQTGFQPAVMGLYRAVADLLGAGVALAVTPVFFRRRRYEEGRPWATVT